MPRAVEPSQLLPFPDTSRLSWRRLDAPGTERAEVLRVQSGWQLTGAAAVDDRDVRARLHYAITCDAAWHTRTVLVEGSVNTRAVRLALTADGAGTWRQDDQPLEAFAGVLDIDLGFSPMTNTLPIRRLDLAIGATQHVETAWLRFPELHLERLQQSYMRQSAQVYRYTALVDGSTFTAQLDADAHGRVLQYEGLWAADLQ